MKHVSTVSAETSAACPHGIAISGAKTGKRILIVQTQAENAGAQEVSRLIGDGLARAGHEVRHLFFYRASPTFTQLPDTRIVCERRPGGPLAFVRFLARLVGAIRRERPDIVLTFQHYGNVFGAPAARLAGVRHVVANHVSARATINGSVRVLDKVWGRAGLYDAITVNSNDLMRDYQDYPAGYTRRIGMIPHGFQVKTSDQSPESARAAFGLPLGVPLIGSLCRLHPLKQVDHAIALLEDREDLHLALAGQGPDRPRLESIARQSGVADRLHFIGEIGGGAVGQFLRALDLFVFPTAAETFGLAAVEAGQAGLPVIANDLPVLREVLSVDDQPCAVFVRTEDRKAFGAAVGHLLADPAAAKALSDRGRRLRERYSLDAMIDAYRRLID